MHRRRTLRNRLTSVTLVAVIALLGACTDDDTASPTQTTAAPADTTTSTSADVDDERGATGIAAIPDLVRRIEPSIVAVVVTRGGAPAGEGSGVIVRSDGVIVTNNHVIVGATEVAVVLVDGTEVSATVEATDPLSDLAILRRR